MFDFAPEFGLLLPIKLSGERTDLVFGDKRDDLVPSCDDLFLDGGREIEKTKDVVKS